MPNIITKDGAKIYYKDWGKGQPVVFSHGWPLNGDAFEDQMFYLTPKGYRCIAHDQRGHGRSSQPWNGNDMDTYADDLSELIEKLDLKNVILVGHSTGGGEVTRYIGRHGNKKVAKLVLISAVPPLMVKTADNPGGLPLQAFDQLRANVVADRSQFFKDLSMPFYGYNRPNARISEGVRENFWHQGMVAGLPAAYFCFKAFSEKDMTEDLKRIDVRQVVLGSSVFFFAVAALIFGVQFLGSKSPSLYWYALAIGLVSIGLFSAFEQKTIVDVPTWLGRLTLYTGTFYLVAALLASRKSTTGTDIAGGWAEAFRSNREQFATLFSNMLDAFLYCKILVDKNGKPVDWIFLDVNDAYSRIVGLKREQIIGKKVNELFPEEPKDPADWIGRYGRVALTGEPAHFESYRQSLKKWLNVSAYSPKKDYFIALFVDITERKNAEEALKENQNQLKAIFDSTPDGVILFDENFRYVEANPAAAAIYGVSRDQLIGRSVTEFTEPNYNTDEAVRNFLKTGHYFSVDKIKHPDGTFSIVESTGTANVLPGRHLFINHDITERKKAEEALTQSEHRYRQLFSSMTEMFQVIELIYDNDGKAIDYYYREVNPAFEKLVAKPREQLVNKRAKDIFGVVEDYWIEFYDQVAKTGTTLHFENYGAELDKWYEVYAWKTNDKQVAISFTDITERKQAELKFSEYRENLEKLVEERTKQLKDSERLAAIGATAGMVGHDIRNPLQAITSDVYLAKTELASTPESEEKKNALESLQEIEKNIDYINKIVQDLQDFARPLNPKAEEADLKLIIAELLVKQSMPNNIELSVKIENKAEKISADSYYINRIMHNLVTNAVQAMPNGGTLTIHAFRGPKDIVITVKDTGVGIPKDVQGKMFTLMFTTKAKGQGFGLPVVKRMTEALGGTITFESQEGKGTTFTVRLPLSR